MSTGEGAIVLDYSKRKLAQWNERIALCLDKLREEDVWVRGGSHENAVGNLVLHLCGNVRQWIVSAIGGAEDTRRRDAEFAARTGFTRAELKARLAATTGEAVAVLDRLPPERLLERIEPQGYQVTVLEGILHVLEHFSHHTGQIIFATKMVTGEDLAFYKHLNRTAPHSEKTP